VREAAEYPNSFIPLGPGEERIETERYTLCMSLPERWNTVQRQRFSADEVDEVLDEVRGLLRDRGRKRTQWEIGSEATPATLTELLLYRGLIRDTEPFATAMALTGAPPPPPAETRTGRVETLEDYLAAAEVQLSAFGAPAEELAAQRVTAEEMWRTAPRLMHAVWLDGAIVGAGTCAPTPHGLALFGGATLPSARGRGAYRALISARWEEARERELPALLTQAGAMSRPILERLGFEQVGHVDMLLDEFDMDYASEVTG
jgi:GNAT superfamily N-acetyltransferase